MGKVIATDLDGTLFYPKKRVRMISKKSVNFIRNHIDNGGKIVLVTGRNEAYLKKVAEKIDRPVDMIGCNGSFIIADNEVIQKTPFDVEKVKIALDKIESQFHPKGFFVMTTDGRFIVRDKFESLSYRMAYVIWNFFEGVYREPFYINKKDFNQVIDQGKIAKIMIFFGIGKKNKNASKEANKILRDNFADSFEASWSGEFIELSPVGCSKSEGLKSYLKHFNINHSDVYVVGDSGNDISMFNEFPENSFCMKHAPLSVSKYAKHTIKRFYEIEKYID